MKPYARGKSIFFREVTVEDSEFIVGLRTDPEKNKYLSTTSEDIEEQKKYCYKLLKENIDYYFIICDWDQNPIGTIRIYDFQADSFCWGSWIIAQNAPASAAIESALLSYDFAFLSLHYRKSHFDVRKKNTRVLEFHKRFGASVFKEDELNYFFSYDREAYLKIRAKYKRYLP